MCTQRCLPAVETPPLILLVATANSFVTMQIQNHNMYKCVVAIKPAVDILSFILLSSADATLVTV